MEGLGGVVELVVLNTLGRQLGDGHCTNNAVGC